MINNSSAITLTSALLILKNQCIITNALHFRETIASASALLFFGQLPTSDYLQLYYYSTPHWNDDFKKIIEQE